MLTDKLKFILEVSIPAKIEEVVTASYPSKVFIQKIKEDIEIIHAIATNMIAVLCDLKNYKNDLIWYSRPSPDKDLVNRLFGIISEIEGFEVKGLTMSHQNNTNSEYNCPKGLF